MMQPTAIALNRFGLGARAQEASPENPKAWLRGQLEHFEVRPDPLRSVPDTAGAIAQIKRLEKLKAGLRQRARSMKLPISEAASLDRDALRQSREERRAVYPVHVHARTLAAIESRTPFAERLVHFWSNHFAVSVDSGEGWTLSGPYEFEAIRPNILGNFGDLLRAAALHPAMQLFLDQATSYGPNSTFATRAAKRGREIGLNENLAREILELHTLGVRSGYTQDDVTELARALTGWTVEGARPLPGLQVEPDYSGYLPQVHEPGTRVVLGRRYGDNGKRQALTIFSELATHPATAKHIATKLARHFAGDDPPARLVDRLETAFNISGGDLPTVYAALIDAPEVWNQQPVKFRQPWEWLVAAMRALDLDPPDKGRAIERVFAELGQPVWQPGSPAGYPDEASRWAAPDALIRRIEAGQRLAAMAGERDVATLAEHLFPGSLGEHTQLALARAESPQQALALLLAAPEMMRR